MTYGGPDFSDEETLSFVHGTAPQDLAARIEDALQQDPALAAEIALMRNLKPALAQETANPPGELDWRRLDAAIEKERSATAPARTPSGNVVSLWKVAAVVFGLATIGQAAFLTTIISGPEVGFQTASDPAAEHVLVISFMPETTELEMRSLLQDTGARLIDGPGASGLYRIAFDTADALQTGRDQIANAEIVDLVADE